MSDRHTPERITSLPEGSVFVFGSDETGAHGGGAALVAHEKFGAVWGKGEGLAGQSYALPTMEGMTALKRSAQRFIDFATTRPDLEFYLTKVGCGIAGFAENEIAPLFAETPPNVIKPQDW